MHNLFVMCGSAGAGKTTMSKILEHKHNAVRYSFDEMHCIRHRELIPYIIDSLKTGKNVVVDALYDKAKFRQELLQATNQLGCKRILVYVNTELAECINRNLNRETQLPVFIIESIYHTFEPPNLDEGWDEIIEVRPYDCL